MSVKHTVTCQAVSQLTVTTSFHAHMASLLRTTLRRSSLVRFLLKHYIYPFQGEKMACKSVSKSLKNTDGSIQENSGDHACVMLSKQVSAFSLHWISHCLDV